MLIRGDRLTVALTDPVKETSEEDREKPKIQEDSQNVSFQGTVTNCSDTLGTRGYRGRSLIFRIIGLSG